MEAFLIKFPPVKSMRKSACYFNGKIFNGNSHCKTEKSKFFSRYRSKLPLFAIYGTVKCRAEQIDLGAPVALRTARITQNTKN